MAYVFKNLSRRRLRPCAVLCALALSAEAHAAPETPNDRADRLLKEGLHEKLEGDFQRGCRLIQESVEVSPGLVAEHHLADCRARLGMPGRAALDATSLAQRIERALARPDLDPRIASSLKTLKSETDALSLRLVPEIKALPSVAIQPSEAIQASEGLEITLDGVPLTAARWSSPLAVDAGHHEIAARARGKKPGRWGVDVVAGPYTVALDKLEDTGPAPGSEKPPAKAPLPTAKPVVTAAPKESAPPPGRITARDLGIGAGLATGVAGIAVGVGYGLAFLAANDAYEGACRNASPRCPDRARTDVIGLRTSEIIGFATGLAGFAAAGLLSWILPVTPARVPAARSSLMLTVRSASFALEGSF